MEASSRGLQLQSPDVSVVYGYRLSPRDREMESDGTQAELPSLRRCIRQGIRLLYLRQQFCDVTLVAEGKRFPCHRALLASVSLYFQRMFTSSFKESREGEIILKDLSATSLQSLLDYVYTGQLLPQAEDAEQLFTAASRLQMAPALEIVSRFLAEQMSAKNCLELYMLAFSHNHVPLLCPALCQVTSCFQSLAERAAFLSLDLSALISIITSDSLAVDSEMVVYRAVRRWVGHNLSERLQKFTELMGHIRLPLLDAEELAEVRADTAGFCKRVRLPWEDLGAEERLWASGGLRRGMYHEGIVCVGLPKWSEMSLGEEELDSHVHFFDPATESWEQLPDLKSLTSPGCVSMGHRLYVTGGQHLDGSYSPSLLVYDALGGRWSQLPSMSMARAWHAFLRCQKKLYVAGGWDHTGALVGAESFDLEAEAWSPIASLPFTLRYFASTSLQSKLYLIGGEMDTGDPDLPAPHRGFLVYDTASKAWSTIPTSLDFYEASAITLDNTIFVVGGLTEDGAHGNRQFTGRCVCLLRDGTVNQDTHIPPLPIAISYPGVVCWQKRIYVFGGDSSDCYSSSIHYWAPGQQDWIQCSSRLPDPNYGAFGFGCIPLKVPRKKLLSLFQRGSATSVAQGTEQS